MEIALEVDDPFQADIIPEQVEDAVRITLDRLKETSALAATATAVNIIITDNDTIQQLNRQYRDVDAPTDVLSFENVSDPDFPEVDPALTGYLGDIIIAYPIAQSQAQAAGHTPQEEIMLLAVHGVLHLLGFDHDTPEHKTDMWTVQYQIMAKMDLAHIQPTET